MFYIKIGLQLWYNIKYTRDTRKVDGKLINILKMCIK